MESTTVADASVLINFMRINRMDLIMDHPNSFISTKHVAAEIEVRDHSSQYNSALANGCLGEVAVDGGTEMAWFLRFASETDLGLGECSAAAVAVTRNCKMATDDKVAIKRLTRMAQRGGASLLVMRTQNIMVDLISCGVISLAEADHILQDWRNNHSFALKISSFEELL